MNCKKCGAKLKNGAKFCQACGEAVENVEINNTNNYQSNMQEQQTPREGGNGLAIASVVLGALSFFLGWVFVLLPIIGLILGICQKKTGALKVVGIVLNSLAIVVVALIWFFAIALVKSVSEEGPENFVNNLFGINLDEWEEKLNDEIDEDEDLIDEYFHTDENGTTNEEETPIEDSVEPAGL